MRFQQHLKESFFNDCNFGSKAVNLLKHIIRSQCFILAVSFY